MRNWKLPPSDPIVAKYIECYWFLETSETDVQSDYRKLNPDPAAHLIITNADHLNQYKQGPETTSFYGSHLILPHCETIEMDHSKPFQILGVKFQVGALYTLKPIYGKVDLDRIVKASLNSLYNIAGLIEQELILQASEGATECCKKLDMYFASILLGLEKDKHAQLVSRLLRLYPTTLISEIGGQVGLSQRTVERSFLRVTGLTLRQYYSMERLEALLDHLHKLDLKHISWAAIAADFGFSDQPHLIRYLKKQLGHTPQQYAQKRDLAIDSYGNFE